MTPCAAYGEEATVIRVRRSGPVHLCDACGGTSVIVGLQTRVTELRSSREWWALFMVGSGLIVGTFLGGMLR